MNRYFHNLLSYFIIILFATNCQVLVSLHEQTECELDELCNHINTNIQSLQRIVSVNNDIDYITEIQPLKTNGQTLGYSIDFEHSNPIIIYSIGKFGCVHIPKISVKRGCDGIWYWMVNGEYLLDELGNCAQTSVVTPKLKIKNNVWFISSNDEKIWFDVGDVLVEQDIVNEYLYISVYQDEDTVSFQLIDGQILIIHKLPKKDSIKILCFGNSFTEDSMSYVPYILQNIAPDLQVTLGIAYIGGSPLAQHCAYLTNETILCNNYTYSVVNSHYFRNEMEVFYTYHKNQYSSIWESKSKISIEQMLLDEEWDIITFQQSGGLSHQDWTDYYEPYIYIIQQNIISRMSRPVKLGWLSVHSSYEKTDEGFLNHWLGTTINSYNVIDNTDFSIIFPYGTSVQNLRTTKLKNLGNGSGHNLTYDNAHLQEGLGCLAAAYANALVILRLTGRYSLSVIGDSFRPEVAFIKENHIPSPHWLIDGEPIVIGINETNCNLAQIAAELAIERPFELYDMSIYDNVIEGLCAGF